MRGIYASAYDTTSSLNALFGANTPWNLASPLAPLRNAERGNGDADSFVKVVAARLLADTEAMWSALAKVGSIDVVTYTAESSTAIVSQSRGILKRLVAYAESRNNGEAIANEILQGDVISTSCVRTPYVEAIRTSVASRSVTGRTSSRLRSQKTSYMDPLCRQEEP